MSRSPRRGAALLLSLAVLSVLAALAVMMVRTTRVAREAGANYGLAVRAGQMAEAGVEFAVGRLRAQAAQRSFDSPHDLWRYRGEDLAPHGELTLAENRWQPERSQLDGLDCPLSHALAPSFAQADNLARLERLAPAVSWARPLGPWEQGFALRVVDCASQIDLNAGLGDRPSDREYQRLIGEVIDRLWAAILARFELPSRLASPLGTRLMKERPLSGFASDRDLAAALGRLFPAAADAREAYRRLAPRLALHPWRDQRALLPPLQSRGVEAIRGLQRLAALEVERRAPLNVNTADALVLEAMLSGLAGRFRAPGAYYHTDPETGLPDYSRAAAGSTVKASAVKDTLFPVSIPARTARRLAAALVRERSERPFASFAQLTTFLRRQVPALLTQPQADLLLAQLLPDADLNRHNPDAVLCKSVDKAAITSRRTELCLSSMGRFEISSRGLIIDERGRELAVAERYSVVRIYEVIEHTSARDFATGSLDDPVSELPWLTVHPERGVSYDGQLALGYVHPAPAVPRIALSAVMREVAPGGGAAGSSYAEALAASEEAQARSLEVTIASYRERLAALESMSDHLPPGEQDPRLALASRLKALERARDDALARAKRYRAGAGSSWPDGGAQPGPLVGSRRGWRFIDGAYGEGEGRFPWFRTARRFTPQRGAMVFWYKPNWDVTSDALRPHSIVDLNGKAPGQTFQLYYDSKLDPAAAASGGKAGGAINFLAWDSGQGRKVTMRVPMRDEDSGEVIGGANQWLVIGVAWDRDRLMLAVGGPNQGTGSLAAVEALRARHAEEAAARAAAIEALEVALEAARGALLATETELAAGVPALASLGKEIAALNSELKALPPEELDRAAAIKATIASYRARRDALRARLEGELPARLEAQRTALAAVERELELARKRDRAATRAAAAEIRELLISSDKPVVVRSTIYTSETPLEVASWVADGDVKLRLGGPLKVVKSGSDGQALVEVAEAPSDGTYSNLFVYGVDPSQADVLAAVRRDIGAIANAGMFVNGVRSPFYRSAPIAAAIRHPVGTISWRAHLPAGSGASLLFELQREGADGWETAPGTRLTGTSGRMSAAGARGRLRYRVFFRDAIPASQPLYESAYLDGVRITVLSPPLTLERS